MTFFKVRDLCEVTSSRRIFAKEYKTSGIPFFRSQEVIECSLKGKTNPEIFISEERYLKLVNNGIAIPKRGDILISAIGANRGYPWCVNIDKFYFKDGNVVWLRNFKNICKSQYLSYFLSTKACIEKLQKSSEHSAQGAITIDLIKDIELIVPDILTQQHIVNTIGTIDDLIEKNNQFLLKFQDFLILMYYKNALKCSDAVALVNLITRTGKIVKDGAWKDAKIIDLSSMPNGSIFINEFSTGENFKTNIKGIENFDLVYGSIRPYFKKAGFALDVEYIAGTVFSFKTNKINDYLWILACISSKEFHSFTSANSQGTKMPIITWDTFVSYKIPYSTKIVQKFSEKVKPLFEICIKKMRQNRKLKNIKQNLLAKYF